MGAHAKLSPSGADRWMSCAASVAMEDGIKDTAGDYANEGTCAHFLAADIFEQGYPDPATVIGRTIEIVDDEARWAEGTPKGYYYVVDDVMLDHVLEYVSRVKDIADAADVLGEGARLFVEVAVPIGHLTGETGATGTSDAIVISGRELQVHDLKYGMGLRVEAEENKQMKLYALGALEEFKDEGPFDLVRLVIHQPRLSHSPEFTLTVEELTAFGASVAERAKVAGIAATFKSNWCNDPEAEYFTPGEKQCQWCKAKADCPALDAFVRKTVGGEFDDLTAKGEVPEPPVESLSLKLHAVPLIELWCKAIRGKAEAELIAGRVVEGFKLVPGRKGTRAWTNAQEAEKLMKGMEIPDEVIYRHEVITPTVADKMKKVKKISAEQWEALKELIVQADGKPSVAPINDPRPVLVNKPVEDSFENMEDIDKYI